MNAFFFFLFALSVAACSLQPSYKLNSPDFSGISTHADTEAEQHWALEEKKPKSHHDLKF